MPGPATSLAQTERFSAAHRPAGTDHSALFWLDVIGIRGLARRSCPRRPRPSTRRDLKPYLEAFDA